MSVSDLLGEIGQGINVRGGRMRWAKGRIVGTTEEDRERDWRS